jgi:cyanophycinase
MVPFDILSSAHSFHKAFSRLFSRWELRLRRTTQVFLAYVCAAGFAVGQDNPSGTERRVENEHRLPKGRLVIVGGGDDRGTGIMETFVNLAGGQGAKFVIVPTAGGNRAENGEPKVYQEEQVAGVWKRGMGLEHVRMLHTHDPQVANSEEFVQVLRDADAVWFMGGRQWHLVDSYKNTLTEKEFHNVLARGGVIGGTSAGATVIGDYLVRGAISGPDVVMAPEPEHQQGFAFLPKTAIDQHINRGNRWDDLTLVMKKFPDFLGIGLSEGTAIIVEGERFEVWGKWKVALHDPRRPHPRWEKSYFVLSAGDVYNLRTRTVEKYGNGPQARPALIPKEDYLKAKAGRIESN